MKLVKLTVQHNGDNKVSAIKVWRTITGYGLKESKDFIDSIFDQSFFGRKEVVLNMAQYAEIVLLPDEDKLRSGLDFSDIVRYVKPAETIDFSDTIPK